jgi:hypothetical protein
MEDGWWWVDSKLFSVESHLYRVTKVTDYSLSRCMQIVTNSGEQVVNRLGGKTLNPKP